MKFLSQNVSRHAFDHGLKGVQGMVGGGLAEGWAEGWVVYEAYEVKKTGKKFAGKRKRFF
jgi:hypothetical protein